jgi:hypothetical protein
VRDDDEQKDAPHAREVEWRWGETDAYKVSQERHANYTTEDLARAKKESDAVVVMLAEKMRAGLASDHEDVMAIAELHREHISTWWYPCSYDMQVGLSDMYVHDARFTKVYDDVAPGLAQFLADAILANAVTHGASPERSSTLESLRQQMGVRASAPSLTEAREHGEDAHEENAHENDEVVSQKRRTP